MGTVNGRTYAFAGLERIGGVMICDIIDMGPGGGDAGGQIVASGTPQEIRENKNSITGGYL